MEDTQNQAVATNRQKVLDKLQKKYPDKDFSDEEAMFGQISDDSDDYDQQLGRYKEDEKSISDMFSADPRSAYFLASWKKGSDPAVELVRQFGTEIKDAIDDPARLDAIEEANKEYLDRTAKSKELDQEYQNNLKESLERIDQWQNDNGLTDDQVDEVMQFLITTAQDVIMGKFTPEAVDMAQKAINHDADVAEAADNGEVRGRNAKIEEKLRKRSENDGLPAMGGGNGASRQRKSEPDNIFALADMAR